MSLFPRDHLAWVRLEVPRDPVDARFQRILATTLALGAAVAMFMACFGLVVDGPRSYGTLERVVYELALAAGLVLVLRGPLRRGRMATAMVWVGVILALHTLAMASVASLASQPQNILILLFPLIGLSLFASRAQVVAWSAGTLAVLAWGLFVLQAPDIRMSVPSQFASTALVLALLVALLVRYREVLREMLAERLQRSAELEAKNVELVDLLAERDRLEADLQGAQRLEAMGRVAGGIAHDFNNLLTVIRITTDLADVDTSDQAREDFHEIRRVTDRASGLTRQLLSFAKRRPAQPIVVALTELVGELTPMLRHLVPEGITLTVDLGTAPVVVYADPSQLEQVVLNLVVNARDATPMGGHIVVTVRADLEGQAVLSVRDSGAGIPDDVLPHIFEPFFTTKKDSGGTGLGLATCYGIAQQAGGALRVRSVSGEGAAFTMSLPQATGAARRRTPAGMPAIATNERRFLQSVLVVERDPDARVTIQRVLRRERCDPTAVADARAAELLLPALAPDILLVGLESSAAVTRVLVARFRAVRPDGRVIYVGPQGSSAPPDEESWMRMLELPLDGPRLAAALA